MKAGCLDDLFMPLFILRMDSLSSLWASAQACHGFPMTEIMTEKYKDKMKACWCAFTTPICVSFYGFAASTGSTMLEDWVVCLLVEGSST